MKFDAKNDHNTAKMSSRTWKPLICYPNCYCPSFSLPNGRSTLR